MMGDERELSVLERMRLWATIDEARRDVTSARLVDTARVDEYLWLVRAVWFSNMWAERGACVDGSLVEERLRAFRAAVAKDYTP